MATQSNKTTAKSTGRGASKAGPRTGSRSTRKASTQTRRATTRKQDAIALLKADHREVEGWFKEFEKTEDDSQKLELARKICMALTVHTQIEEEIFYPAAREGIEDDDLLDEAEVEHASAKQLIAEIQAMQPGEPLYDAKVKVLGEYVQHHVDEEEKEMFAEARDSDMDLKALGEQLAARKAELMAQAQL